MAFSLPGPAKLMSFLTISNENIFSKTHGTRLSATVVPNKGLEQARYAQPKKVISEATFPC